MQAPTLTFLGATQNVTGSRFLVSAGSELVLVDCGLVQEREFLDRNWDPFPVEPSSISAVLLTHAHIDHSGYLPKLVKDGFTGPVYCTGATADITGILLEDSGHIQVEDAWFKKQRHAREGRKGPHPEVPLYTPEDALAVREHFRYVEYGRAVRVTPHVSATFNDASHILGSATIKVTVEGPDGEKNDVIFSGDLGRKAGLQTQGPTPYESADYVVVESTYGDRLHETEVSADERLAAVINETVANGGNVVIPAFAVERAQDLLWTLRQLLLEKRIPRVMFFVDSPLATDVTKVFERHPQLLGDHLQSVFEQGRSPFKFPGLHFVSSVDESKAINFIKGSAVIIAGSGMCNGGRIKHHLANNIEDPKNTILFVGYQAEGTLGRKIVEGDSEVRILGIMHPVRAKVVQIDSLSAHADRDDLTGWLEKLQSPPKKVFVVHGAQESCTSFVQHLRQKTGWDVTAPTYRQVANIT